MAKILSSKDSQTLKVASDILKDGGIIVFPTETVYGVGAILDNENSIKRIYEIKGRDFKKPLLIHISKMAYAFDLSRYVPDKASDLMKTFWPGPLSIILEASCAVPRSAISYGYTVGLRMPSNKFFKDLGDLVGPIAATSANLSGQKDPLTCGDAYNYLKDSVDLYVDDGPVEKGLPSTVIDMTANPPKILRIGAVSVEEIEKVIGKVSS
ncbi:MAG: L-threonylcarbamoyladenylate synthase [Athalassotoga sp.]|uniref:L-threonylcarbamoyladenylate synthase n=1 Tax=Athalassotoga sp. TaxID=2022597 RepID=UPI003CFCC16F